MPIHYVSLTTEYQQVALPELREEVEKMEALLTAYRVEEIGKTQLRRAWAAHRKQWICSTVPEVFSSDPDVAADAVNRNEMLYRYLADFIVPPFIEEDWKGETREQRLQDYLRDVRSFRDPIDRMLPPLL